MLPGVVIAGLTAAAIAAPVVAVTSATGTPTPPSSWAPAISCCAVTMGTVQVGPGLTVFTIGARHVPAVELALVAMTELVLAPALGLARGRRGAERVHARGRCHHHDRDRLPGAVRRPPPAPAADGLAMARVTGIGRVRFGTRSLPSLSRLVSAIALCYRLGRARAESGR